MFYNNLLYYCEIKNTNPSAVAIAIGLTAAAATGWKKGKVPHDITLQKLASYFGISVSDLIGDPPPIKEPAPQKGADAARAEWNALWEQLTDEQKTRKLEDLREAVAANKAKK